MPRKKGTTVALARARDETAVATTIASRILAVLGEVPVSSERKHRQPAEAARKVANVAARKAAAAAGTLAMPPGPLGWLTILPELVWVWKIQAQMVADIAAFYGRKRTLTQEQMLYCLFKHTASQALRDIVVQAGERVIVRRATVRMLNAAAQKVGVKISQRALARTASRWLPVIGALGVAGYAYYDTAQVARTTIELYEGEIEVEVAAEDS